MSDECGHVISALLCKTCVERDFEAQKELNAFYVDKLNKAEQDITELRAENERLKAALKDAKECIRIWHNMDCHGMDQEQIDGLWQSYDQNSPEMKRINAMLEAKP